MLFAARQLCQALIALPAPPGIIWPHAAPRIPPGPDGWQQVSIFLSPLDVHINRSPVTGKIEQANYQRGKFLAAYKEKASAHNEQNALKVVDDQGRTLGVVQIAGVVARRIVCRVKRGDNVKRGDRFGLIMFGSRTDAYLPRDCRIEVTEGQRVKGGETILGRFV